MKYDEVTISRQLETVVPVYVPDMSTPIGRLKHLRHVVGNIPDALFNIDTIAKETPCGTTGCMIGHAALDPHFQALGLRLAPRDFGSRDHYCVYGPDDSTGYTEAGSCAFGITDKQATRVFSESRFDEEPWLGFTKAHGIARIDRLIAELSL